MGLLFGGKPLLGEARSKEELASEKKTGIRYSEVTLGKELLIHTYFFQTRYIAYKDISRIYMRVAGGEFGEFPMDEYSLVIIDITGKEHVLHMERGEYIEGIQDYVKEHFPQIQIGKPRS